MSLPSMGVTSSPIIVTFVFPTAPERMLFVVPLPPPKTVPSMREAFIFTFDSFPVKFLKILLELDA